MNQIQVQLQNANYWHVGMCCKQFTNTNIKTQHSIGLCRHARTAHTHTHNTHTYTRPCKQTAICLASQNNEGIIHHCEISERVLMEKWSY